MMRSLFFISFWVLTISRVLGGEIVLSGTYQGKSVFVQNPYNHSTSSFCTQEVYINDHKVFDAPQISAFKIDLTYLKTGDLVVIRITFADGCMPRVVNPQVIQKPSTFKFVSNQSDNNSLSWTTAGELSGGQFIVEQYQQEKREWYVIKSLLAKGNPASNQYAIAASHIPGENKYRIRYEAKDGDIIYSVEVSYTSTDEPVTFYPEITTTKLTLSDSVAYSITDYFGKTVKKGRGKEIMVMDLNPGEYYLNIQNRKEKFVKK